MSIRIYVGNLPYTYREAEVAQLFAPYGEVREVRVITDRDTRQSKGFAFVELASDEAARQAPRARHDGHRPSVDPAASLRRSPAGRIGRSPAASRPAAPITTRRR